MYLSARALVPRHAHHSNAPVTAYAAATFEAPSADEEDPEEDIAIRDAATPGRPPRTRSASRERVAAAAGGCAHATAGEGAEMPPAVMRAGESGPACMTGTTKADAWGADAARPSARAHRECIAKRQLRSSAASVPKMGAGFALT